MLWYTVCTSLGFCLLNIFTMKCVHNVFILQLDKFLKNPGAYAMPRLHGEQQCLVRSKLLCHL